MLLEKITAEQLIEKGVVSAPDKLEGDPQENKYRFDRLVAEAVAPIVNACIDTVNSVEMQEETIKAAEEERKAAEQAREEKETGYVAQAKAAASAARTAAENAAGSEAEAAAAAAAAKKSETNAEESARKAAQAALGQIPDGSLEPVKLSPTSLSMMVRENLIDNGVFINGCLVDQRGGYVVKPGAVYYVPGESAVTGTTDTYYKVDGWAGTVAASNAIFYKDGKKYVTAAANTVRGYTGVGAVYTIDRWFLNGGTLTVVDGGINLTQGARIAEYLELSAGRALVGKTLTASALVNNVMVSGSFELTDAMPYTIISLVDGWRIAVAGNTATNGLNFQIFNISGKDTDLLKAAQLELGSEQTFAHLENGNWVLNEIPDYNEQLLRCCMSKADPADTYANNKMTPAAINAVNKAGDTMTGELILSGNGVLKSKLTQCNFSTPHRYTDLYHENKGEWVRFRLQTTDSSGAKVPHNRAIHALMQFDGDTSIKSFVIHGAHNKPTGSYTGNGDATSRTIDTGGIGRCIMVNSTNGAAILSDGPAFVLSSGALALSGVAWRDAHFANGIITLATNNEMINANGVTYHYQVL